MSTTTRNKSTRRLTEKTHGNFDRIDRDAGVIRGVRVLGLESKNGRRYLREAVLSAMSLYEGARVYLDHQAEGERNVAKRWGRLINVREASDGGLVADLEYLKSHPLTEAILESAEKFLDIGLSHDSLGRTRMQAGERVVYEIVEVKSVDLVERPATTDNLWESRAVKKKVLDVLREHRGSFPVADQFLKRLAEMADESPEMMADMDAMEMPTMEADAPADDEVKTGLRQAMMAILDNDDDAATTIKKLRVLLSAQEKMANAPETPAAGAPPMETEEAKKMTESIKRLEDRLKLLETAKLPTAAEKFQGLLESKNRDATPERLRLLEACKEEERLTLVESWPARSRRPATSPARFSEGASGVGASKYFEARKSVKALAGKAD